MEMRTVDEEINMGGLLKIPYIYISECLSRTNLCFHLTLPNKPLTKKINFTWWLLGLLG